MQVWCNDKLVGNLNVAIHPDERVLKLIEVDADSLPSPFSDPGSIVEFDAPVFQKYEYRVERLRAGIEIDDTYHGESEEMIRQVKRRYHVPDDAEPMVHPRDGRGSVRHSWTWRGIKVNVDQLERLFDHSSFEPV